MDRIQRALTVAFEQHRGQTRKVGGTPYIVHILDVARLLMAEPGVCEDVIVAGILHDVLEDTHYTAQQLEQDFGPAVLALVLFASEPEKGPETTRQEKARTWRARKMHTIEACAAASRDQLLVLVADKLSNLASLQEELSLRGDAIWSSFNAPKDDIAWYHRTLRAALADKLQDTRLLALYTRLIENAFGT
jgi:(p)ppGpp synthase/HD superfamily hydrolase